MIRVVIVVNINDMRINYRLQYTDLQQSFSHLFSYFPYSLGNCGINEEDMGRLLNKFENNSNFLQEMQLQPLMGSI